MTWRTEDPVAGAAAFASMRDALGVTETAPALATPLTGADVLLVPRDGEIYATTADDFALFAAQEAPVLTMLARLYAAMAVEPDATRKTAIRTLVTTLVDSGIASKLDALYVLAAHTQQAALLNWIDPTSYNAVAYAGPTYTQDVGFTGNGSSQYLATGFVPSNAGGNLALDNATIGVYIRTNTATAACSEIGARDSTGTYNLGFRTRASATEFGYAANSSGFVLDSTSVAANRTGHIVVTRQGTAHLWVNGSLVALQPQAGGTLPNSQICMLAMGINSGILTPSPNQISYAYFGKNLAYSDIYTLDEAMAHYLDTVGAATYVAPSIWTEGDSYVMGAYDVELHNMLAAATGRRVISTAVSGSTMTEQRNRVLAAPFLSSLTYFHWDGSAAGYNTASEYLARIDEIIAAIPHSRVIIFPPGLVYTDTAGTISGVQTMTAGLLSRKASGLIETVDIIPLLQTLSDGSANDLADVAAGLFPRSILIDGAVHLNGTAMALARDAITSILTSKGW